MISKLKALKDKYFDYSMLRWGVVGVTTTTIDYLLFISLYGPIKSVYVANLMSGIVGTSFNYSAHKIWTFKSNQNFSKSGTKYLLNLVFWWIISTSIIKLLIGLDVDPKIAKLIPIMFVVPLNFFILKKIVFRNKF